MIAARYRVKAENSHQNSIIYQQLPYKTTENVGTNLEFKVI